MATPFSLGGLTDVIPSYANYGGSLNMQGLANQTGQGAFPLAGANPTYADRFKAAYQQAASAMEPLTKELPADQKFVGPMMGFNLANQMLSSDPEMMMQTLEKMEPFFQRRAEKQQQLAKESILFGSVIDTLTNKLPEAIGGVARAPLAYANQRIQIADNFAARGPNASAAPRNYYGFVG
jgi:hypothetical protein